MTWYLVAGLTFSAFREHTLTEVVVNGKKIGLVRKQDKVHAFAATCPHAGAPLCTGWLDAQGRIVCPDHKYRFDPTNGRNTSGEGYKLFTYPTRLQGDEIWIGLLNQTS